MIKQKKPYIPPKVEFHSARSDAHNRFHALLDEEMKQTAEFQKNSPSDSSDESFSSEECREV